MGRDLRRRWFSELAVSTWAHGKPSTSNMNRLLLGTPSLTKRSPGSFLCTKEAPVHNNIKEAIVKGQETDTTLLLRRWTNTTRLYKNKVTTDALKIERESKTGEFSEVAPYVSGKRGKEVFINGDPEHGVSDSFSFSLLSISFTSVADMAAVIGLDDRPGHGPHSRYPDLRRAGCSY